MPKLFPASRLFLVLAAVLAVVGCVSASDPVGDPVGASAPTRFEPADYRLGPGDKIRITVFGETDLSGTFAVDGAGLISMPLIGEVKAASLTVREVQSAVDADLRNGYLKDPRVSAEVVTFRPYYILGEVKRPGTYAYQNALTVLNAVATAEGFTFRANQRVVFIRRDGEPEESKYRLSDDLDVRPGDTIRIAERLF